MHNNLGERERKEGGRDESKKERKETMHEMP
jgi:hypothetical protein